MPQHFDRAQFRAQFLLATHGELRLGAALASHRLGHVNSDVLAYLEGCMSGRHRATTTPTSTPMTGKNKN